MTRALWVGLVVALEAIGLGIFLFDKTTPGFGLIFILGGVAVAYLVGRRR